jgi:predicted nucleic acid-binding protein
MVDVFLDTDVAFDLISAREPYFDEAVPIMQMASQNKLSINISEACLSTLIYLSYDIYKLHRAKERLLHFVGVCNVLCGGKTEFFQSMESDFVDKEDGLQYYVALNHHCDYFISRNVRDYNHSVARLPVYTPTIFLKEINSSYR